MKKNYFYFCLYAIVFFLGSSHALKAQCTAPTGLLSANSTTNSVDLIWNSADSVYLYEVRYRSYNSSEWTTVQTSSNIFSLTDLLPGNSYYWKVNARCGTENNFVESGFSATRSFTTLGAPSCPSPSNLTAGNIQSASAEISWTSGVAAESYEIKYRPETSPIFTSMITTSTSATLTDLVSGTEYVWQVRTICAAPRNISNYSSTASFQTSGPSACPAPQALNVQNIGNTSATLAWDAIAEAGGTYLLKYRIASSPNFTYITVSGTSVVLSDLSEGTEYVWLVQSVCSAEGLKSQYSEAQTFTTNGPPVCTAPGNLATQNISDVSAQLSWSAEPGDIEYVLRYRSTNTPIFTEVYTSSNTYTLSNLNPEQSYVWILKRVCSPDRKLMSSYSPSVQFTTKARCAVPELLAESSITDNSAVLDWEDVNNVQNYTIRYRRLRATSWNIATRTASQINIINLFSGTNYEWQVRTVCSDEMTGYSPLKTFTTTGEPACPVPTSLSANNITDNSAQLNWNSASGALEYEVRYRNINGSTYTSFRTTSTNLTLNSLVPGNSYIWQVRNICSSLNSEYSGLRSFTTTGESPCSPPQNLMVSNIDNSSATISWDDVPGALSYEIRYRVSAESGFIKIVTENNSYNFTNLFSGTEYLWKVRANCSDNLVSVDSDITYFTTLGTTSCGVPINPLSFNLSETEADLAWNTVSGALFYEIKYRPTTSPQFTTLSSETNFLNLTELNPGATYVWMVKAVCSFDNSLASFYTDPAFFETTGEPACTAPTGLFVNNISSTSVTLNWSNGTGVNQYEIKYRSVTNPQFTYLTSNTNALDLSGLQANTRYVFLVKSICGVGNSSTLSNPVQFSTLPEAELLDDSFTQQSVLIFNDRENIHINFKDEEEAKSLIKIYDSFGNEVAEYNNTSSPKSRLNIPLTPQTINNVLIIKVINHQGVTYRKLLVL